MTTKTARTQHAIDGDALMKLGVEHARKLAAARRDLETQEQRVKRVLVQTMRENGATELTLDGEVVVRLVEYMREGVKVAELREAFPAAAAALVSSTPVVRVDLP
jgi:hypothetical protein